MFDEVKAWFGAAATFLALHVKAYKWEILAGVAGFILGAVLF